MIHGDNTHTIKTGGLKWRNNTEVNVGPLKEQKQQLRWMSSHTKLIKNGHIHHKMQTLATGTK